MAGILGHDPLNMGYFCHGAYRPESYLLPVESFPINELIHASGASSMSSSTRSASTPSLQTKMKKRQDPWEKEEERGLLSLRTDLPILVLVLAWPWENEFDYEYMKLQFLHPQGGYYAVVWSRDLCDFNFWNVSIRVGWEI